MAEHPITEESNLITKDIDVSSPKEIVSLLQKCDAEIFDGWKDCKSLVHKDFLDKIAAIARKAADLLKSPSNSAIVLSGCGTSGRLGFITARTLNALLQKHDVQPIFQYLLAGGDVALFTSQEAPEDDPHIGIDMLKQCTSGKSKVLFIGITCGLSAPFVAGQLDYCLQNPQVFTPVLLGFNPVHLARNNPIHNWNKTFLQVSQQMEAAERNGTAFILNPVIGPEPITGSSRMKGGTATKLLLEAIFVEAYKVVFSSHRDIETMELLNSYRRVCDKIYTLKDKIGEVIELAGKSLKSGGSIYYLGSDSLGIMGMIDASECPPTYGATLDCVRGFFDNGYQKLGNKEGSFSTQGKHFRISLSDFTSDISPILSTRDTVIILSSDGALPFPPEVFHIPSQKVLLSFGELSSTLFDVVLRVDLPTDQLYYFDVCQQLYREIGTKWILNAISTGAHVLKGKVFQNIMVDLKVSNTKLFHRSVGIIERLGKTSKANAKEYLLRSIYECDNVTEKHNSKIPELIKKATFMEKVVPTALVALVLSCSINDARQSLTEEPVIRTAVLKAMHSV